MSKRAPSKPAKSKAVVKAKAVPKAAKSASAKSKPCCQAPRQGQGCPKAMPKPKVAVSKAAATASTTKPRTQAIDKAKDKKLTAKAGHPTIVHRPTTVPPRTSRS